MGATTGATYDRYFSTGRQGGGAALLASPPPSTGTTSTHALLALSTVRPFVNNMYHSMSISRSRALLHRDPVAPSWLPEYWIYMAWPVSLKDILRSSQLLLFCPKHTSIRSIPRPEFLSTFLVLSHSRFSCFSLAICTAARHLR